MKNNKFAKISLIILALALCFGAVFAMTAGATTGTEKPKIVSQNIEYGVNYKIMYAVDAEGITGPVTLKVYDTYPESDSVLPILTLTDDTAEANTKIGTSAYYIFTTNAISHLNMTDNFYVTAETEANGVSEVKRYSVAEYLYERLADVAGKTDALSVKQRELYNNTIAYGTNLQELVTEKQETEDELIKNLRYVVVKGGKLDTYFAAGVYPLNSTLPLTADDTSGAGSLWTVTAYKDGAVAGEPKTNQSSVTVEDADVIAVEFGEKVTINYRDGYDDLNSYAGSNAFRNSGLLETSNNSWAELVTETETEKYGKNTFYSTGEYVYFNPVASELTSETANAFEVSLDFWMENAPAANSSEHFEFRIMTSTGAAFRVNVYPAVSSPDDTLRVEHSSTGEGASIAGVNTDGWINLRAVIYSGDSNLYIYINGSEEACKIAPAKEDFANVSYADITKGGFMSRFNGETPYINFDNIFVGFINETAPAN